MVVLIQILCEPFDQPWTNHVLTVYMFFIIEVMYSECTIYDARTVV